MKAVFLSVAAALLLAGGVLAQTPLVINTPTAAVVCQPLLITWSGGTPPYFLSILPGNQPGGPALFDFGQLSATQLTWVVNSTSGTSLGMTLRDSIGIIAQSASFIVQPGRDTSCLHPSSTTTTSHRGHTTSSTRPHTTASGSISRGAHTSSSASHRSSTTSHTESASPRPPSLTLSPTGTGAHIPVTTTPTTGFSGSSGTSTDSSTTPTAPTSTGTSPAASTTPSSSSAAGAPAHGGFSRSLGFVSVAVMVAIL